MKNRKGFTLVELLAVIVVLSIVLGLTAYIVVNAINSAKEKSYKITKTSVEKQASNYLLENADKLFFISEDNGIEYQCITVENLIEFGYLKNDILNSPIAKDKNVKLTHYIFLERDANTRAITKTLYTETDDNVECVAAVSAKGDISVLVSPSDTWATEREITITYKVRDVIDMEELRKYEYNYSYTPKENGEKETQITNDLLVKKIKITSEGTLESNIKKDGSVITSKKTEITGIDRIGPVIALGNNKEETVRHEVIIPLVLTDEGIGPNYETFTTSDLIIKIGDTKIDSKSYELTHKSGKDYNLTITDNTHKGKVTIEIDEKKIEDKLKNPNIKTVLPTNITFDNIYTVKYNANGGTGSMEPSKIEYGKEFTTSKNTFTKKGYTFNGWKETDGTAWTLTSPGVYESGKGSWTWKYTKDIDLNAQWKAETYTVNYSCGSGATGTPPSTFTVEYAKSYSIANNAGTCAKKGHTFTDWLSPDGTDGWKGYSGTWTYENGKYGVSNNKLTLTAKWTKNKYTINYSCGSGATGTPPSTSTVEYGDNYTIANNGGSCQKNGNNFVGWASPDGTDKWKGYSGTWTYENGTYGVSNNKLTLTAVWSPKPLRIYYSKNGNDNITTIEGKCRIGTADAKECKSKSGWIAVCEKSSCSTESDLTYAYQLCKYGNECDLLNYNNTGFLNIKKSGYIGVSGSEWCSNTNGTGSCFDQNNSDTSTYEKLKAIGVEKNDFYEVSLYVNWTQKPIRIFFNTNGGTVSGDGYSGSNTDGKSGWVLTTLSQYKYTYDGKDYASQKCTYGNNCNIWNNRDGSGWSFSKSNSEPKNGEEWIARKGTSGNYTYDTKLNQATNYTYDEMVGFAQYERTDYYEVNLYVHWNTGSSSSAGTPSSSSSNISTCETVNSRCRSTAESQCSNGYVGCTSCGDTAFSCITPTPSPSSGGGGCFLAGTKIKTPSGYIDIDKLKIGDKVLSYNEETQKNEYHEVTYLFKYNPSELDESLYTLIFDDKNILKITSTHRIYIKRNNTYLWLPTKEIKKGDYVKYADGTYHKITKITHKKLTENVYNLSVANTHNFYVGEKQILVHNVTPKTIFGQVISGWK